MLMGARVLKNFGDPLATKFTYKMRSGGKRMWGPGPALYKYNYLKKIYLLPRCNGAGAVAIADNEPTPPLIKDWQNMSPNVKGLPGKFPFYHH